MGLVLQGYGISSQDSRRRVLLEKKAEVLIALGINCHRLAKLKSANQGEQIRGCREEQDRLRIDQILHGQLLRVEEVLERLKLGEYGICQKCGFSIPATRLRVIPLARCCPSCLKLERSPQERGVSEC